MQDHQQSCRTVALPPMPLRSDEARIAAARGFADELVRCRTVRQYASTPVPRAVIEHRIFVAAGTEERECCGQPAPDCRVPDIQGLALDASASFL